MHLAGEGRDLVLVAHFQRLRVDLHRLLAVLRETLQGIGRTLRHTAAARRRRCRTRRLRRGLDGQKRGKRRRQDSGVEKTARHHGVSPVRASDGLFKRICTVTPLSKRTRSPPCTISNRLEATVPLSIFSVTGFSETTLPLLVSTTAWARWPSY